MIAGRRTEAVNWLKSVGMVEEEFADRFFPTLRQAVRAFKIETQDVGIEKRDLVVGAPDQNGEVR